VAVHAIEKTFEWSRVYTDRVAHPIEVDIRACAGGNAGARVRADVAGMGPASLR